MDMISILIPVYKESDLVETLLNQLIKDPYKDKEIITVIDEPTENSLKTVKKYKNRVKFILNKERKGKVTALNEATKITKGDIFLFLDSDTIISNESKNFLKKVEEEMEGVDLIDIKKKPIMSSLFSKVINYEYLAYYMSSFLCSKIIKKCAGIGGQAFAIKRNFFEEIGGFGHVISEDLEIGIQTFIKNKTFKFVEDIEVFTKTVSSWKCWLNQRERWAVGASQHFKKHWKIILKESIKHPKILLMSLYLAWPTLLSFLSSFLVDSFLGKFFILSLILLSLKFTFISPIVFILSLYTIFIRNALLFFMTYIFSAFIFYLGCKKFKHYFSKLDFTIYYVLYSPISSIFYNFYFIKGLFSSEQIILKDWKV